MGISNEMFASSTHLDVGNRSYAWQCFGRDPTPPVNDQFVKTFTEAQDTLLF
jgi:hypothetical protein